MSAGMQQLAIELEADSDHSTKIVQRSDDLNI